MIDQRTSVCRYLPERFARLLSSVSDTQWRDVHEVRLRVGMPLLLVTATCHRAIGDAVTQQELYDCYLRCCGHAVHTHEEELQQGFVTTQDGFRVGLGGTAVMKNGKVVSYRDITSLCIRIPRSVNGCATPLLPFVDDGTALHSVLIGGTPGSGKTTLLRDLAKQLAASYRVCVVDERFELSAGGLLCCDVLRGCPKAVGILQAIRTLSPDVVIVDELGGEQEWEAVLSCCYCGVPVVASAHMLSRSDVLSRPALKQTIKDGGFSRLVFLPPRRQLGDYTTIWKARDVLAADGDCLCRVRLRGDRGLAGDEPAENREALACVGAVS